MKKPNRLATHESWAYFKKGNSRKQEVEIGRMESPAREVNKYCFPCGAWVEVVFFGMAGTTWAAMRQGVSLRGNLSPVA